MKWSSRYCLLLELQIIPNNGEFSQHILASRQSTAIEGRYGSIPSAEDTIQPFPVHKSSYFILFFICDRINDIFDKNILSTEITVGDTGE